MIQLVEQNLEAIRALCREFDVLRLELFGSAAIGDFDPVHSDVDFLVQYPPGYDLGPWMSRLFELQEQLEAVLQRKVDLIQAIPSRNPFVRCSIDASRQLLYDARDAATAVAGTPGRFSCHVEAAAETSPDRRHHHAPTATTTAWRTPGLLWTILDASRTALDWTAGLTQAAYERDIKLSSAVERNLGIIGRALTRLAQHDPDSFAMLTAQPQTDAVRYLLGHAYDEVDTALAWESIEHILPTLVATIVPLLPEDGRGTAP